MLNVSDLEQEQGGFGSPFLESLKPSSFLTLPLTTKGAHSETAVSLPMVFCCGWTCTPQHMGVCAMMSQSQVGGGLDKATWQPSRLSLAASLAAS